MHISPLIRSILSHFKARTIRTYLVVLPDQGHIEKPLKLEDLWTERGILDMRFQELSIQQKRIEGSLTDLTRCIRGMEFDVKVNSELDKREREKQARGVAATNVAQASDKKSPKVGDFSE
ncbi:uncharacterized protein LOC108108964 [Drosophila eugracilis]|uniref:uncharacterized protein LOC108108964 n=1 Tax=Drosophila eugracilis TaxID=29029 RepID=UPI0007E75BD4|nr:uncharacterized protein LOC108108964 [Drosophila eugracilis]